MNQRKYFDCFAFVGKAAVPSPDFPNDIESLKDDMAYSRIHAVAAIHNASRDYSLTYGNRLGLEMAKNEKRIYSISAVNPFIEYETNLKGYYRELLEKGSVGLAVLQNAIHSGSMEPSGYKKIAEALMEYSKPLCIMGVFPEEIYKKANALASEYPELPIILQGTHWCVERFLFEILEKHDNIYFEISQNQANNILEHTKKHFGIHRALYSSEWPLRSMGAIKSLVEYADITEEEKNLVAHGNACRLFGISPDELVLYDEKDSKLDSFAKYCDEGNPIPECVIDPHSHIVANNEFVKGTVLLDADYKSIASKMDRLGINTTITAPWIGISYDGIKGNEETLEAHSYSPEKFLGFSCCNINNEDISKAIEFHEKYPDVFVGIKPYPPYMKFRLTDDKCAPWFEYANEHKLIALIHADCPEYAEQTDILSEKYPNITFILAHSGASYDIARKNSSVAKKHDNVVLDITYTSCLRGMIEFLVGEVGAEKVLFSTDMPMRDPAPQLGWVCYAKISAKDKNKLLSENILRILSKRTSGNSSSELCKNIVKWKIINENPSSSQNEEKKIFAEIFTNGNSSPVWNQHAWQDGEYAIYIRKNGCGHCCTAMALNLHGIKINPHEEFSLCRKMWGEPRMGVPLFEDNFLSPTGIAEVIKSFGINANAYGIEKGKTYEASLHIEKELQRGKQVILWSHPSERLPDNPFSMGEHYVLAVGYTPEGKILIANSSDYAARENGIQSAKLETIEKVLMDETSTTDYTWGRYDFSKAGSYVVVG